MGLLIINIVKNYYIDNTAIKNLFRYIAGEGKNKGKEHLRFSSAKDLALIIKKQHFN